MHFIITNVKYDDSVAVASESQFHVFRHVILAEVAHAAFVVATLIIGLFLCLSESFFCRESLDIILNEIDFQNDRLTTNDSFGSPVTFFL